MKPIEISFVRPAPTFRTIKKPVVCENKIFRRTRKALQGICFPNEQKGATFFVWERHVLILALAQRAYLFPRKVRYWAYLLSYLRPNPSAAYREKERGRRGLSRQTNGSGHIETLPEIASAKKETWIVRR